ncbi:PH domain-containing protein [Actinomyces howellii]|uniref:Bacterial membrane flanked domain n=2 Tax=Actinomyces howellii TaxID=52771 RepID=A0A448HGE6_9ACTO|nr:PH domain-containing protein [Actinomyces howellii]VEG27919.1 Bacterial membrane flanked domain [Actinomyces howellii]
MSAGQPSTGGGASRMAVPDDLVWHRMHPITPVLTGWKIITAVIAFATVQNVDTVLQVWESVSDTEVSVPLSVVLTAVGGTLGLIALTAVLLALSWRNRSYAVDPDAVYLRWGIAFKQLRTARLPRIQSVDIVHPLLGRLFGLGQLTVEVAGAGDSRVVLGYLRTAQLNALRDRILDLASGAVDAGDDAGRDAPEDTGAPAAGVLEGAPSTDRGRQGRLAASRRAPLGFEDAALGERLRSVESEEHPLYSVKVPVLLGSMLRSPSVVLAVGLVLVLVIGVIVSLVSRDEGLVGAGVLTAVLPALAGPLVLVGMVWSRFNGSWGFRAAATPAGIRLRYGLTSEASVTLPPGRVHAVVLSRPLLWARKDWWRVEATVAGRQEVDSSSSGTTSLNTGNVLLPVGERETALRALWLVVPDLGVPDPDAVLAEAMSGRERREGAGPVDAPGRGFVGPPRRARIFSPLAWRRTGVMLTDTCVILRHGRWWLYTTVVPYERIQSLRTSAGPLARRLGLAKLRLDMVPSLTINAGMARMASLPQEDAAALAEVIAQRALRRRSGERLDRWLARASSEPADPTA